MPAENTVKTAPFYVVVGGDLLIDAPIKTVWQNILKFYTWQNYTINEHVSGPVGAEGEIIRLKKEESGYVSQPYFARTIKLEPEKRALWKTFRDTPNYFGIVDFKVFVAGGGTRFRYDCLYEYVLPENEGESFRANMQNTFDSVMDSISKKLKKLCETGSL